MSEHQDPRRTRRQAQLKIWGIPVGTPPPVQPVPERIKPRYSWKSLLILGSVFLGFILFVVIAQSCEHRQAHTGKSQPSPKGELKGGITRGVASEIEATVLAVAEKLHSEARP
jgi:hypothetical protein